MSKQKIRSIPKLRFSGFKNDIKWYPISEVFVTKCGYTPSTTNLAFWTDGTIPYFRMEDIRINGRILHDSFKKNNI